MKSILRLTFVFYMVLSTQFKAYSQWEEKNITTISNLSSTSFMNDEIGFVVGGNNIFKTLDGGDSWTTIHTAGEMVFYEDIIVINQNEIIAIGKDFDLNKSQITRSVDGGEVWTEAMHASFSLLRSVYFPSSQIGYCSGGNGTILKSIDAGESWQELNTGTSDNLQSIHFINDSIGIVVGGKPDQALILKTKDGGLTWNEVFSPANDYLQSVYLMDQNIGYAVGWNGGILKTNDCGESWILQNAVGMTANLEITFTDEQTGYIVGGLINEPIIQKTSNGGSLWEDVSPDIASRLTSICFPSNDVGYAVGELGAVIKTVSGGMISSTIDYHINNDFKFFPNPTTGILNVQSANRNKIERIIVLDSQGRRIMELNSNSVDFELDLSNLASNVYFMEIHTGNIKSIQKIIVTD